MTQLSTHFSLEEMTATMHRELDNTPSPAVVAALTDTCLRLEAVRQLLGSSPLHINSGYRSPAVNAAVGGTPDSAHMSGHAADFVCPAFGDPVDICRQLAGSPLQFDQVIEEGTWVHIAFAQPMRREVLTKNPAGGYRLGLAGDALP